MPAAPEQSPDYRVWQRLPPGTQAQLRYALMRELAWCDWDDRPAWWWRKEHATLLAVKTAAAREEAR